MQKRTLTGYITLVQEGRFRLLAGDGRSFIFTLDRRSSIQISDIRRLQNSRTTVRVEYLGEPNMASGVVHAIRPVSS
jgi:hypothetical protein